MLQRFSFEYFLILFILIQPIIDLVTSLSIFAFNTNFTFGVFLRFGVMFLLGIYILFSNSKYKKVIVAYLILLGIVLVSGLVGNYFLKSSFSLFSEVRNVAKIAYFPIVMFGYLLVFEKMKNNNELEEKIQKSIFLSMLLVSVVMIIATITNTGIMSYGSDKVGHQGWFYAGNEVGAIMAINFGFLLYYAIKHTTNWKKTYYWIPILMMIFSMQQLGTKVGYGAVLIILVIGLFMNILDYLRYRKVVVNKKAFHINISLNGIILVIFILITPFTPAFSNTSIHLSWVGLDKEQEIVEETPPTVEHKVEERKKVENVIFSGRENFLQNYKESYQNANNFQKLLGMGQGGNNVNEGHPIEMDFYDIFFSIGVIGFVIYLIPILYLFYKIVVSILFNFIREFNRKSVLIGASILLGLGVAYTAGHVLTAPAVSIYLAILTAYLFFLTNIYKKI